MSQASATTTQPTPTAAAAAPSGKPVVACQGLTKIFKDFWLRDRARAVDDVTFQINQGEIFGLLGPNGSGKSTTIKMLLGLLRPTKGRLVVFGKAPTDVGVKKRIGYLPEESYLYGFLNARETLDYYGKLFNLDGKTREKRIDELLEMVGLTHTQHRPVRDYSKGMQRRIGIAQALINDPDFLILDEPTTGLDPIGTRQVKDLILELGRRGKTVLLSSHLLADVEDCVDRMVILYGGRIRDEGPTDTLLTAAGKTTIETDDLDEETLAEIDEVIRRRTNGEKSVRRVAKPRQKLEELFLDIVARAQAEKASTSGALHGGETASFLKSEEGPGGEELIDNLVSAADERPMEVEDEVPAQAEAEPQEELIDALLEPEQPEPAAQPTVSTPREREDEPRPEPQKDEDLDDGLINSLLGGDGDTDKPGGSA